MKIKRLHLKALGTGVSKAGFYGLLVKNFWFIAALLFAPYAAAQVSSGTAFAVAPGLLVTNQHVVDGCASVEVLASDGRRTGAVVDADALIDLALIRVTGLKGATARLRSPRSVRLGEAVMVFGFPLSGSLTSGGNFTSGLVSGLRGLRDAAGEIQITAPVQPGNSGGPVMDASGLVVGVVQAKLDALRTAIKTGDIPQNVNFAVSLDVLAEFLAKNKVSVRDAAPAKPLDTASVAELAQSFTYRVECRGKAQQAAAPNVKPPQQVKLPENKNSSKDELIRSGDNVVSIRVPAFSENACIVPVDISLAHRLGAGDVLQADLGGMLLSECKYPLEVFLAWVLG